MALVGLESMTFGVLVQCTANWADMLAKMLEYSLTIFNSLLWFPWSQNQNCIQCFCSIYQNYIQCLKFFLKWNKFIWMWSIISAAPLVIQISQSFVQYRGERGLKYKCGRKMKNQKKSLLCFFSFHCPIFGKLHYLFSYLYNTRIVSVIN